jgi:hypothetical protein
MSDSQEPAVTATRPTILPAPAPLQADADPAEASARKAAAVPPGAIRPAPAAEGANPRAGRAGAPAPAPAIAEAPQPLPTLADFATGPEHRLRDLLAFAMAVEGARPLSPDGVETLRRKAEGDLHAHAFRILHNQVEAIRRQAVDEQVGRLPRPPGFSLIVVANLVALGLAGAAVLLAWLASPNILPGF